MGQHRRNDRVLWKLQQWRCEQRQGRRLILFDEDEIVTERTFDRPGDIGIYAAVWWDAISSLESRPPL